MPKKREDIKLQHNLLDIVGETLLTGIQQGRLNPKAMQNFQADLGMDLGDGYSANLGYNQYMGDLRQDLKFTLSKKLKF